jgi:hypothetical protein
MVGFFHYVDVWLNKGGQISLGAIQIIRDNLGGWGFDNVSRELDFKCTSFVMALMISNVRENKIRL